MLWSERFALGLETIDRQHKRLFDLIEEAKVLLAEVENGKDVFDEIGEILNALADYTIYHFQFEEALMAEKHYQHIENHKKEHDFFVKKISDLLAIKKDQQSPEALNELVVFLLKWVSDHILYTDAQYVVTMKK